MPAISSITINDGKATPVAVTLTPVGRDSKTGVFFHRQTTPTVTNMLAAAQLGTKDSRQLIRKGKNLPSDRSLSFSLQLPTVESLSVSDSGMVPAPTLAYVDSVMVVFTLSERATSQERKDLRVLLRNFLDSSMAVAMVDNGESLYSA